MIGDTVNLASRIEQLTKMYQARLLVSDQTVSSLTDPSQFELRRVDRVIVKGKHAAVDLFEVIDADGPQRRAAKLATRALLDTALKRYLGGDFEDARRQFEHMQHIDPLDTVPELFIRRCHRNLESPPPADWGGAEKLASK